MPDWEARCRVLEAENDDLRERISTLEEALGVTFDSPPFLELSRTEAALFGVLMARDMITKETAMTVLYGLRVGGDDIPEIKIVDVLLCKLRAKLKPWGIDVETIWGRGYYMTAEEKAKARAVIAERSAA